MKPKKIKTKPAVQLVAETWVLVRVEELPVRVVAAEDGRFLANTFDGGLPQLKRFTVRVVEKVVPEPFYGELRKLGVELHKLFPEQREKLRERLTGKPPYDIDLSALVKQAEEERRRQPGRS